MAKKKLVSLLMMLVVAITASLGSTPYAFAKNGYIYAYDLWDSIYSQDHADHMLGVVRDDLWYSDPYPNQNGWGVYAWNGHMGYPQFTWSSFVYNVDVGEAVYAVTHGLGYPNYGGGIISDSGKIWYWDVRDHRANKEKLIVYMDACHSAYWATSDREQNWFPRSFGAYGNIWDGGSYSPYTAYYGWGHANDLDANLSNHTEAVWDYMTYFKWSIGYSALHASSWTGEIDYRIIGNEGISRDSFPGRI